MTVLVRTTKTQLRHESLSNVATQNCTLVPQLYSLRKIRNACSKPDERYRKPKPLFRGLENYKSCDFSSLEAREQIVVDDHFGNAATIHAAREARASDILVIDLQPKAGGHQHAKRCQDSKQKFLIRRPQEDDCQSDIRAVLGGDAL
jgi:hypothetical protein